MNQAFAFLLDVVTTLATIFFLARFLLQAARADFYNPLSQAVVRLTDPVLKPMRLVLPPWRNLDFAALIIALLVQALLVLLLTGGASGFLIAGVALFKTVTFLINILRWSIVIVAIASFIAPGSHHLALQLLSQITEPLIAPVRRLLPAMGGLDFSPLIVLVGLSMLEMILADFFGRFLGSG
ncbi:MAG: YggT family protein [Gammaproteobacteria bacterium]|nr:YggT family protein [Gammaproteobacteria bacterium]